MDSKKDMMEYWWNRDHDDEYVKWLKGESTQVNYSSIRYIKNTYFIEEERNLTYNCIVANANSGVVAFKVPEWYKDNMEEYKRLVKFDNFTKEKGWYVYRCKNI